MPASRPDHLSEQLQQRARRLSARELRLLHRASSRSAGWLGTRRGFGEALAFALAAGEAAGRHRSVSSAMDDGLFAVLDAATDLAHRVGRDVGDLRIEMRHRRDDSTSDDAARLIELTRRSLGWRANRQVAIASVGVGAVLLAARTWDLADPFGTYTFGQRDELLRPWLLSVAGDELSAHPGSEQVSCEGRT